MTVGPLDHATTRAFNLDCRSCESSTAWSRSGGSCDGEEAARRWLDGSPTDAPRTPLHWIGAAGSAGLSLGGS